MIRCYNLMIRFDITTRRRDLFVMALLGIMTPTCLVPFTRSRSGPLVRGDVLISLSRAIPARFETRLSNYANENRARRRIR